MVLSTTSEAHGKWRTVVFTLDFYEKRQAVTCVSLCLCHCVTIEAVGSVGNPRVCLG